MPSRRLPKIRGDAATPAQEDQDLSRAVTHRLRASEGGWQQGDEVPQPRWDWWRVLGLGLMLLTGAVTLGAIALIWWLA